MAAFAIRAPAAPARRGSTHRRHRRDGDDLCGPRAGPAETAVPALHVLGRVDALHNNVFGRKIMKDGSQRREPETSVFVLIARRMEPEHPAVRLKGHSAQAPEWPFAISRSVSARRKRAVIEIARGKTRSRRAAYRPCTARLIESPTAC
jgi:hypothetical protein